MSFLVLRAYLKLIQFDLYLARGNFKALYAKVRNCPIEKTHLPKNAVERICAAVDTACLMIGSRFEQKVFDFIKWNSGVDECHWA